MKEVEVNRLDPRNFSGGHNSYEILRDYGILALKDMTKASEQS